MSNPRMRIDGAVRRYYEHLAAEARNRNRGQITGRRTDPGEGTVVSYNQTLSALVEYCHHREITHVHLLTKRDIDTVINNRLDAIVPRRTAEPSRHTMNNHIGAMRSFLNWCGAPLQNYLSPEKRAMLTASLKDLPTDDDEPALIVPKEEWAGIFAEAGKRHLAERVYLELGYTLMLRDSEVCRLTWNDLDLDKRRARAYRDKRADRLSLPIPDELYDTLMEWREWLMEHNGEIQDDWHVVPARKNWPGRRMFPGWPVIPTKALGRLTGGRIIKPLLKALGYKNDEIDGQASHVMRRSGAAHLYEAGYDLNLIRRALGHKTIAQTMHYIRRSTDDAKVVEMLNRPIKNAGAIVPSQTGHKPTDIPPADASRILAALMADLSEAESVAFAQRLSRLQLAA